MTNGQLLIPLAQAGRILGMSRPTLRRRIDAQQVRTVKIGPRSFVPRAEIERILSGQPETIQSQELSLALSNQIPENGPGCNEKLHDGKLSSILSAEERLSAILEGYADYVEEQEGRRL